MDSLEAAAEESMTMKLNSAWTPPGTALPPPLWWAAEHLQPLFHPHPPGVQSAFLLCRHALGFTMQCVQQVGEISGRVSVWINCSMDSLWPTATGLLSFQSVSWWYSCMLGQIHTHNGTNDTSGSIVLLNRKKMKQPRCNLSISEL